MSEGRAQLFQLFLGSDYSGFKVYHYAAGTTADKTVWTDAHKINAAPQPAVADSNGWISFYADGDYRLMVTDSNGVVIRDMDDYRVTSDTATLWEGNVGTSYPAVTSLNQNQLFIKTNADGTFSELGFQDGDGFDKIVPGFQWVSVKDYGATGDGATDDTTAIQDTINAVDAAGGGTVYFPAGVYLISDTLLVLDKKGMALVGEGWTSRDDLTRSSVIKLADGTDLTMLSLKHSTNVSVGITVRDLAFDGNKSHQTAWSAYNYISNNQGHGIRIDRCAQTIIERVLISDVINDGISTRNTAAVSNVVTIKDTRIVFAGGWGIYGTLLADSIIRDCYIGNCGSSRFAGGHGLSGGIFIGSPDNIISNCHVFQATGNNILVKSTYQILIENCRLDGSTRDCLKLLGRTGTAGSGGDDGTHHIFVMGGIIFDGGVYQSGGDTGSSSERSGIGIDPDCADIYISDVVLRAGPKSYGAESYVGGQDSGVRCEGRRCHFDNVTAEGNRLYGFWLPTGGRNRNYLTNCISKFNGVSGYNVLTDNNEFRNCQALSNGVGNASSYGFRLAGDSNLLLDCVVANTQGSVDETLTEDASAAETALDISDASALSDGDTVLMVTDFGAVLPLDLNAAPAANTITILQSLQGSGVIASSGNAVKSQVTYDGVNVSGTNNEIEGLRAVNILTNDINDGGTTTKNMLARSSATTTKMVGIHTGTGTPESVVTARVGSLYLDNTGGAGVTLYVKETGDNTNTGWVAK